MRKEHWETPSRLCETCHYKLNTDDWPEECPACGDGETAPQQQDDGWLEDMGM